MNYLSLSFLLFVAGVILAFYILPKKLRGPVLLCASLVFYGLFDLRYFIFLLFVALTTFLCAFAKGKQKKPLLILCIAVNTALWLAIKVFPWASGYANSLLQLLGLPFALPETLLIVPVGISYYLLQAFSYLIDTHRGTIPPEKKFWKYLLFLSYFPAVVQGPISRYSQLSPQLQHTDRFDPDRFTRSAVRILFGVVKKMVIADGLAIFVNYCFGHWATLQGGTLYLAILCYSFQLYADFSGCVDICLGVSDMLGIRLAENFQSPYLAGSIKEFWSRWHISLSSWLRDYIYIPLGGNRKGTPRKYLNLLLTFCVSGIWHGAGLNFLVWGLLHGIYQIVGEATATLRQRLKGRLGIQPDSLSDRFYKGFLTFHLTAFAWIFFRADGIGHAWNYIYQMFSGFSLWGMFNRAVTDCGLSEQHFVILLVHVAVLLLADRARLKGKLWTDQVHGMHLFLRWAVCLLLVADVLIFGAYGSGYSLAGFLYGGF